MHWTDANECPSTNSVRWLLKYNPVWIGLSQLPVNRKDGIGSTMKNVLNKLLS